jgi:cation transport regulator ChaC
VSVDWVFGYGSLAALPGGFVARLRDHRRVWGVAMDNREQVPGYKVYRDGDGERPPVWVAFLDLAPAPGTSVNGVCHPVGPDELAVLDRRERNYERADVTALLDAPRGRTWAYLGSDAGRERLAEGERAGAAVVASEYRERVVAAFAALGDAELERFRASTENGRLPLRELRRVDLPGEPR